MLVSSSSYGIKRIWFPNPFLLLTASKDLGQVN